MNERRSAERIKGPFDARWSGASGVCRVPDLSINGCYINSLSSQAVDSKMVVTLVTPKGQTLELPGVIVSVDAGIGFAVRFTDLPEAVRTALADWIASAR